MKARGNLVVTVEIDDDGNTKEITVPASCIDIDGPDIHDSDRDMGAEFVYRASASVDECGTAEWLIYEYPEGQINNVDGPNISGEYRDILESPRFYLED